MNSVSTTAPLAVPHPRLRACAWVAIVGIAFWPLANLYAWLEGLVAFAPVRPEWIPPDWWAVDLDATSLALREILFLILFAGFLKWRGIKLADLGFRHLGTARGWLIAFGVLALMLLPREFVRNGPYPLELYTIYAAVAIGVPVAFMEEAVYRGWAMRTLAEGGHGKGMQVFFSGLVFGLAHMGYLGSDWTVIVGTFAVGCAWSAIYLANRRSLWALIVVHAINDAIILPYFWVTNVF